MQSQRLVKFRDRLQVTSASRQSHAIVQMRVGEIRLEMQLGWTIMRDEAGGDSTIT